MPAFHISTHFYPIRLNAFMRNEVELSIELENLSEDAVWSECDVVLPSAISLASDKDLEKGRLRVGIVKPGEIRTGKCKIYANAKSYPEIYTIRLTAYGFGRDGAIISREEKRIDLRCEQIR